MKALRVTLLVALLCLVNGCIRDSVSDEDEAEVIAAALAIYAQKALAGEDFTHGPCIAETIFGDWSVDIAHDPRQPIDDLPENQCQFYRDGQTHHFVELTPEGELIQAE